ncbi:MAG: hypothetical protein MUE85_04905 [Microscillaceae bacterium]|jgi:tetratricopeptide (TPR) repeat protein|nr:hypothetical protein [Microscillaceae bacterium]
MSNQYQNFFKKALEIQAQRREKLTEAEKKEIAIELGFSEADWQAVLDSFQGHKNRGIEFLKRNNYEKAISELGDAFVLQPEDEETLASLAQAYLGLYETGRKSKHKAKALELAQTCLEYDPKNEQAHKVIDFFNPNKSSVSSQKIEKNELKKIQNASNERVRASLQKAKKLQDKQEGIFRMLRKFYPLFLVLFFVMAWLTFPSSPREFTQNKPSNSENTKDISKSKSLTQEQNPKPVIIQKPKTTPKTIQEAVIPIAFAPLIGKWNQKGYQIKQKNASTWHLETQNQVPLLEFYLKEDKWRIWEDSKPKKVKREEYLAHWEVKILCDSIQHNKLRFNFSAYDDLNLSEKPFFKSKEPIYLFSGLPASHLYPKGSEHRFFLQIPYFDLKDLESKRGFGKKAKRVEVEILEFQTVEPEKSNKKPLKISFEKNVFPRNEVKFWEQKSTFFKRHNHWEQHLWTIEVENKDTQMELAALEVQTLFWDKNGKLITDNASNSYHHLIGEYETDKYILPQSSKRFDLLSDLGEKTVDGYPVPIRADEVGRYEIKVMRVAWARQ